MRYRAVLAVALLTLAPLADVAQTARILTMRDLIGNLERYIQQP